MKRLLLLAYHFPPIGGAGVQRSVKFCHYLPRYDWTTTVVTGPGNAAGHWTPQDATLWQELGEHVEVRRAHGPEPEQSGGNAARRERWLRQRSPWADWWTQVAAATGRSAGAFDAIMATMSPWESGEAAAQLSDELGVPWIADLRDPWALDEMIVYPTGLHRRLELRRMRATLARAQAVVWNTDEARRTGLNAFPELDPARSHVVPNGFDAEDFAQPVAAREDDAFRIVHTGYLHSDMAATGAKRALRRLLGGTLGGATHHTRSHLFLLQALQLLQAEQPRLAAGLELHLAGLLSDEDTAALRDRGVRTHGYLSHADSIALVRTADLLFLPMHDLPPGGRARIVPGKTYEYLASGRPILAAVPDGDARELLQAAGTAFVCGPSDTRAMAEIVAARIRAKRAGEPLPQLDAALAATFDRSQLAKRLASILDSLVPRRATAPAGTPAAA